MPDDATNHEVSALDQRMREMRLIHEAGANITRTLDQNTINHTVHRTIARLMDCDSFIISSYDHREKLIRAEYVYHDGEVVDTSMFPPLQFDADASTPEDERGTQGQAIRTGRSLRIDDFRESIVPNADGYFYDSGEVTTIEETPDDGTEETRSILLVPLKLEDQVTGVIQVMSFRIAAYNDDHLRFVEAIAPYAAIATQNARLFRQIRHQKDRLSVLHELDKSILAMHSFEDITRHALINMQQLIQFDRGAVLFADIATDTNTYGDFVYQVAMNEPTDEWVDLRQALQQTIQNTQMPTIMREVDDGDRLWCAAPMIVGEQLVGALVVNFDRPANPTPADRTALQEIAAQLAIALHTLHLNEQIRRQNEELEQRVQQRTEQLNAALAVERQLSELKARMMSMISHELRNPLTAILASVHILGQYDDRISDARKKEHITKIQRQAEQMRQIMEETLVLGRAETAGLNPHFELYDLSTLIRQQNEDMQSTFPNRTVHYSTSGVPHLIALDPKLIGHVLGNLLSNAAKYSSADKPITCDVHYHDDYAELSISDNGMGIPKEELDHLGEPFFRASNVRTIQGTGLGLSLVRRIVEVHHGTMTIASELYKGTTVTLSLPYRR